MADRQHWTRRCGARGEPRDRVDGERERIVRVEEDMPMRRYPNPNALPGSGVCPLPGTQCRSEEERALLEQLVELTGAGNALLCDLLSAVNGLTAALLCRRGAGGGDT